MTKMKLITGCVAWLFSMQLQAQTWTLKQCMDYAMEHNISLQKNRISEDEAESDLQRNKAQWFPSLTFSTSQNVSNNPWRESFSYTGESGAMNSSNTTYSGNYSFQANWTVWNGGKREKNIQASQLTKEQRELSTETNSKTIQEQILKLYIQILYGKESVKTNEATLEVSKAQRDRARQRVEVGDLSQADLAQLEAQVAQDQYNVVNAKASVERYRMQLKQQLELTGSTEAFDIAPFEVADELALDILPSVQSVYEEALLTRPEIRNSQSQIQSADVNVDIAKAGRMPTVSMNASAGTNSNSTSNYGWGKQMKTNFSEMVGVSVSIPILSQRQNKSAVEKAKLQRLTADLNLLDQQKTLYNTIEGYWLDGTTAQEQFKSASANVQSMQTSFDLLSEQFNLGLKNIVELTEGKNRLLNAEQAKLQAKYTFIMNEQLLRFYAGQDVTY